MKGEILFIVFLSVYGLLAILCFVAAFFRFKKFIRSEKIRERRKSFKIVDD